MSSNEPVKNGCEVTYEMFHILKHIIYHNCDDHSLLDFKSAVQYMKRFIYHFTSTLHGLIRSHK